MGYKTTKNDLPVIEKATIKNAVIDNVMLEIEDHGILSCFIGTKMENGFYQAFGGWSLYLPPSYTYHDINSFAGHFIYRVLEIAEVENWNDLVGKAIRVYSDWNKIHAIGHIIDDDWFIPSLDFKKVEE